MSDAWDADRSSSSALSGSLGAEKFGKISKAYAWHKVLEAESVQPTSMQW